MYNPRLAESIGEVDFVGYMPHLGLAHPKLMDVAAPLNLRCGKPDKEDSGKATDTGWAQHSYTFPGIWELQPEWLAETAGRGQVVDVREAEEFDGALGHIQGARLISLGS